MVDDALVSKREVFTESRYAVIRNVYRSPTNLLILSKTLIEGFRIMCGAACMGSVQCGKSSISLEDVLKFEHTCTYTS